MQRKEMHKKDMYRKDIQRKDMQRKKMRRNKMHRNKMQEKEVKILSVVVPAYNVEAFLKDCLESLLHAKLAGKTEILVIDDGSGDQTGAILDDYAARYPSIIKAFHKENGGYGSAVNMGIAMSSGMYFKVVDGDDRVDLDAYDAYLYALSELVFKDLEDSELRYPVCDLVATPFWCVTDRKGKLLKRKVRRIEGAKQLPKEVVFPFREAAGKLHIRMHEWTIRTAILKEQEIVLSEHSFYVDMQYILFPIPWIKTICILPYPVYCYRMGGETQSVSIKNMQKNRVQHQAVMRSLVRFYKKRELAGDKKEVLSYLASGIAKMEANQVQICLSLPIGKCAKAELVSVENELKKRCPAAYRANRKWAVWMLRKSGYFFYLVAAVGWRIIKNRT